MLFGTSTALICTSSDKKIAGCYSIRIVRWIAYMLFALAKGHDKGMIIVI